MLVFSKTSMQRQRISPGAPRAIYFSDDLYIGYCQAGQIMSAVALLKHNPKPTRDEARLALSGNLCRCGAYDNYLNGVMRAAAEGGVA